MIISINQPAYLPWLGYFHRIAISDKHVILDGVQLEKNSFTNRNKVRTSQGWCWLTVPVRTAGKFGALEIREVEIDNDRPWAKKHWATLCASYSKAAFFKAHAGFFESVYTRHWTKLHDLTWTITEYLLDALAIRTEIRFSSEIGVTGKKDELILNLCRDVGANIYLSGPLGKHYLRESLFQERGIAVQYHEYQHPAYKQVYPGFEPYMTVLDLLFNVGPKSRELMMAIEERVTA
jgi:hypothetical protein